jgi:hypothetical protein
MGHNDTPFGQLTSGRPIGRPGVSHTQGVLVFSYYKLVMLFVNMVHGTRLSVSEILRLIL